jgi:Uma2 family endonuclease
MLNPKQRLLTVEEYLEGETFSDVRHEYINGRIYAMVGATTNHNRISRNAVRRIENHLEGKLCETFVSDMKVKIKNNFFYPDVLVDCSGELDGKGNFTETPTLIIEVLSDSTQTYDRKGKFDAYRDISSLEEYVLVEQNFICIYIFRRNQNWHGEIYSKGEKVHLESIDLTLPIEELYSNVKFEEMETTQED